VSALKKVAKQKVKKKVTNAVTGGSGGGGKNKKKKGGKGGIIAAIICAITLLIGGGGAAAFFGGFLGGGEEDVTVPAITENVQLPEAETGTEDPAPPAQVPTPPATAVSGEVHVHFIDVGQGDAILIHSDTHAMLIDGGDNRVVTRNAILDYIDSVGVTRLDYIVATHPHLDHIGSFVYIKNSGRVDVGRVMMPDQTHTSQAFNRLLDTIESHDTPVTIAERGLTFSLGDMNFTVIAPTPGAAPFPTAQLNDASVVLHLAHGENTFIFTGDAEVGSERDMVASAYTFRADIMQAGHHGSRTSSSEDFINAVAPSVVAISVGAGNSYGHPHGEVMDRFYDRDLSIFRTDTMGTITFTSNGVDVTLPDGSSMRN